MIISNKKIAVCSRSFSKNQILRQELQSRYKNVSFNEKGIKLDGEALIRFLQGHQMAIIGLEKITAEVLSELPELEVIGKFGVGLDTIDISAMVKYKKKLGWTPGVNKRSVAELVILLALSILRHTQLIRENILDGNWTQKIGGLLSGRTVGIVGCNHVGKEVVKLLQPWGCKFLAHDIVEYQDFNLEYGVTPVGIDELLSNSDIVSLHLPLNTSTRNIISEMRLRLMKPTSILINTARGGLVDELALKDALKSQKIAGAALDVFQSEPPKDFELLNLPNLFATPHIGGSTEEDTLAMGRAAILGLEVNSIPNIGFENLIWKEKFN